MRALAERRAVPIKEALESFEFFARVRRPLRAARVADLMCGHGLTGLLFAAYDQGVEEVVLLDRKRPPSFDAVLEAVAEVAPWVPLRVRFVQQKVQRAELPEGASILGLHACGSRTDACLEAAMRGGGAVAVMPCCYVDDAPGPVAVARALGPALAWDVDRTYRLEAAGYRVRWTAIPAAITPMNRVLLGRPAETAPDVYT